MKYCPDANAFIQPWHKLYPPDVFPSLYPKIAGLRERVVLIKPIVDQIEPQTEKNTPELRLWLQNELRAGVVAVDAAVKQTALELEEVYETKKESKGADTVDMQLVAYAKAHGHTVVTLEAKQDYDPKMKMFNYKIPLICEQQKVECINFIEFLQRNGVSV